MIGTFTSSSAFLSTSTAGGSTIKCDAVAVAPARLRSRGRVGLQPEAFAVDRHRETKLPRSPFWLGLLLLDVGGGGVRRAVPPAVDGQKCGGTTLYYIVLYPVPC